MVYGMLFCNVFSLRFLNETFEKTLRVMCGLLQVPADRAGRAAARSILTAGVEESFDPNQVAKAMSMSVASHAAANEQMAPLLLAAKQFAAKKGAQIHTIALDGRCGENAIRMGQLLNQETELDVHEMRQSIVDAFAALPPVQQRLVLDDLLPLRSGTMYCRNILQGSVYWGEFEMAAVAKCFRQPITLHIYPTDGSSEWGQCRCDAEPPVVKKRVHLAYIAPGDLARGHFECLSGGEFDTE
jgi:uncharacterized low-complexity protein